MIRRTALFLCLATISVAVSAEKAYQWKAEDGSVNFSTTPPTGVEYTEFELRQPDTVIKMDKSQRRQIQNKSRYIEQRSKSRRQQREDLQQQINETKKALEVAQQAQTKGEEPQAGEMQRLASGSRRRTAVYFERQEQLKKTVTEHEERLKVLQQELRALR